MTVSFVGDFDENRRLSAYLVPRVHRGGGV